MAWTTNRTEACRNLFLAAIKTLPLDDWYAEQFSEGIRLLGEWQRSRDAVDAPTPDLLILNGFELGVQIARLCRFLATENNPSLTDARSLRAALAQELATLPA